MKAHVLSLVLSENFVNRVLILRRENSVEQPKRRPANKSQAGLQDIGGNQESDDGIEAGSPGDADDEHPDDNSHGSPDVRHKMLCIRLERD